jgi:hypothetical protein
MACCVGKYAAAFRHTRQLMQEVRCIAMCCIHVVRGSGAAAVCTETMQKTIAC